MARRLERLEIDAKPVEQEEPRLPTRIVLDDSRRTRFETKLEEYRGRIRDLAYEAPELLSPERLCDSGYKAALTKVLLETGTLDVEQAKVLLREIPGDKFHEKVFDNAVQVIDAYNSGQTSRVEGGTGFPNM